MADGCGVADGGAVYRKFANVWEDDGAELRDIVDTHRGADFGQTGRGLCMKVSDGAIVDPVVDDLEPFVGDAAPIVGRVDMLDLVGVGCIDFIVISYELESHVECGARREV